jgi:DNA-binding response OmpR family regulator
MSDEPGRATVLVVDDEPEVTDAYALKLRDRYDVETAYGGEEALEVVDDAVDVVLLDRRMPTSGDEVLDRLRERGVPVRVIMLTAIDPEFDIIGMPFDDYLCKPVGDEALYGAIERQLEIATYERLGAYFRAASKLAVLDAQAPEADLSDDPEYAALRSRAEDLRAELADTVDGFDTLLEGFEAIDRESGR